MERRRNYQKEMEAVLDGLEHSGEVPTLLLHSCCAPCSSAVLELLSSRFRIIDYFYDPNIEPEEEYRLRAEELRRLTEEMPFRYPVRFLEGPYDPERFREAAKGLEDCPERGERCRRCFELRLRRAAEMAKELSCDLFATTLTISPLKDPDVINTVGEEAAAACGVRYLPSDFKKKDGYKRSLELSREYGLYRQNYCGCLFSRR